MYLVTFRNSETASKLSSNNFLFKSTCSCKNKQIFKKLGFAAGSFTALGEKAVERLFNCTSAINVLVMVPWKHTERKKYYTKCGTIKCGFASHCNRGKSHKLHQRCSLVVFLICDTVISHIDLKAELEVMSVSLRNNVRRKFLIQRWSFLGFVISTNFVVLNFTFTGKGVNKGEKQEEFTVQMLFSSSLSDK